jgi:multidrug resistance efflux pump
MPVKRRRPGRRKRIIKRILGTLAGLSIAAGMTWLTYIVFFAPEPEFFVTGRIEVWDGTDNRPAEIRNSISGFGFLAPEQSETVTIMGDGSVLESNVWYGMPVNEGDVLVVLDRSSIEKAVEDLQKRITAAEGDIERHQEEIRKLRTQINAVRAQLNEANAEQIAMQRAARMTAPFSGMLFLEGDRLTIGDAIFRGQRLGKLVDDSRMKLTLYFSLAYANDIYIGQTCEISIPSVMSTVNGRVTHIERTRRVVEAEITMNNPGALESGMDATASMKTGNGEDILPTGPGTLAAYREQILTAESQGPLKINNLRNFHDVKAGDLLIELDFVPDTSIEEGFMVAIRNLEEQITAHENGIAGKEEEIEEILFDIGQEYLREEDLIIRSPLSGTVMNWPEIWPGMTLSPTSQPIPIVIAQTRVLTMRGEIYQSDIQKVQVGMNVSVDALIWGEMTRISGTLTQIDRTASQGDGGGMGGTGAFFPVVISVDNSDGLLMEGTSANFSIDLDVSVNPIVVPIQAVHPFGRLDYVFLKPRDGVRPENAVDLPPTAVPPGFYAIPVRAGIQSARFIEIVEGLKPEWDNWEVFTHRSHVMPSPGPSFDFDPGTDDPDLLDWFDKGYQQGLDDAAKASPSPEEPLDPWGPDPWDPGRDPGDPGKDPWDPGNDPGWDDPVWDDPVWNDGDDSSIWDDPVWDDPIWDGGEDAVIDTPVVRPGR